MILCLMRMRARCLEQCSCVDLYVGSKFVLNSQPTVDKLSLHPNKQDSSGTLPLVASTQMVTICAMNWSILFVNTLWSEGGMYNRCALPVNKYPPMLNVCCKNSR